MSLGADPGSGDLGRVTLALRDWIFGLALPFWSTTGMDRARPSGGGRAACEFLSVDGTPAEPGYRRMRVQARQLYVFSEAASRNVAGAGEIAAGIHRFMSRQGAAENGGWARRLHPDGSVLDPANDLYDLAFVLFSLAHHARVTGDPLPLQQAGRTLQFMRRHMARPSGGFANTDPAEGGWRQQNPHMHLLEAALELFAVSGDARWAELAHELVGLFRTRLLDRASGTLGEYFNEDWQRAAGIDGEKVEPGHHAEWIWLLDRHSAFTGECTADLILPLEAICRLHGIGPETGLVRDEIGRDGSLHHGSARLWPQGETIKAYCALHRAVVARGDGGPADARNVENPVKEPVSRDGVAGSGEGSAGPHASRHAANARDDRSAAPIGDHRRPATPDREKLSASPGDGRSLASLHEPDMAPRHALAPASAGPDDAVLQRYRATIVRSADNLLTRYLIPTGNGLLPAGTWIDQLDPFGRPAIDRIPTSSFYHIMSAWVELDRLAPGSA